MNQKQLNKVKSIYKEGCTEEICIRVISSICAAQEKSHIDLGIAIHSFLQWVVEYKAERRLKNE